MNTNKLLNVTSSDVSQNWDKESQMVSNRMFKLFNELSPQQQEQAFLEISDCDLRNDLHNESKSILSNIEIEAKNQIETELGYDHMDGLQYTSFTFVL